MDPSEYYDFEDRTYINPMLSRDEQLGFVDALRDTVGRNTAQINTQTRALGSNLPSTQGGLTGSNSYFAQRYQTAPVETQVNNLRATAQAKALNDLMTNYQNQAQNRYDQAYRSYTKRNSGGGNNGNNGNPVNPTDDVEGGVTKNVLSPTNYFGVENAIRSETDEYYIWTDVDTGKQFKVRKDFLSRMYDENGNLTDEGAVILDTRNLLGM